MFAFARKLQRAGRLAPIVAVVLLIGCSPFDFLVPGPARGDADVPANGVVGDFMDVDQVEVRILESIPVQVHAVVRGTVPDACTEIGQIVQERTGNEITIQITTSRDSDLFCAQVITPVEETIALEGEFPPGDYTLTVNGVTRAFQV